MSDIGQKAEEASKYRELLSTLRDYAGILRDYAIKGVQQYMFNYHSVIVPDRKSTQYAKFYLAGKISDISKALLERIRPKTSLPSDSENNQNQKL